MSLDASLPFFAYGMFRRGELGWLRVRDFVVRLASAFVAGELLERDGLVILDPQGAGQVPGMVAFFDSQLASQAYAAIDELEPEHQYLWTVLEAQVAEAKTTVNALVGRSPRKGSKPLEGPWSGRTDPLLNVGLATVEQLIGESRATSDRVMAFFRLQAAYLLLWSAIERYASFRYGISGEAIHQKLQLVAGEPSFGLALGRNVYRVDRIQRTDRPRDHESLDPALPKKSMNYYYQLRSNVAHRGKAAIQDFERLEASCQELLTIFRDVLSASFDEASRAS